MLVIRYFRTGKKNQPFFKILVTEKKNPPRGGKILEMLGFFNPLTKKRGLKKDRIKYWMSVGAKPSESVYNLIIEEKVIEDKKIPVHKKKKGSQAPAPEKSGEAAPAAVPAAVPAAPAAEPKPAAESKEAKPEIPVNKEAPKQEEKK